MSPDFEQNSKMLVQTLGLCTAEEVTSVERFTGGVASDIGKVTFGQRSVCVKFALAKLKVKEDWYAPIHRGRAEYNWLQIAGTIVPGSVPELYGWSDSENGFAMEYLAGDDIYLWKDALLDGVPDRGEAAAVGQVLGKIHAASSDGNITDQFDNADDFNEIRLDPYLRFTAKGHPGLADRLNGLADALYVNQTALVHGDASPKNILIRSGRPVMLDAECATMGDPSFDVAFCLNHLVLKSIHMPDKSQSLRALVTNFWNSYAKNVTWEPAADLEARAAALLPALMLARIDGKSPVEYLDDAARKKVRSISVPLIEKPVTNIAALLAVLEQGAK